MAHTTRKRTSSLRRRNQALETLHAISLEIGMELDPVAVIRKLAAAAARLLDADSGGTVYLYEPETGLLRQIAAVGVGEDYNGLTIVPGTGVAGRVFATGKGMAVSDYHTWEGRLEEYVDPRFASLLTVPLRWHDQVIGTIDVMSSRAGRVFDEDDLWLLELFAAQAAIAISNARLYEAERAANIRANALLEAAQALSSPLSLSEALDSILKSCKLVLPYVTGSIITFEDDQPVLHVLAGYDQERTALIRRTGARLKDSAILKQMLIDHKPLIIPDVGQYPDWVAFPETGHIQSWLGVPLVAHDQVVGVLSLDSDQTNTYTAGHLTAAVMLGGQAALAIERAQLFEAARSAELRFSDIAHSLSDWIWEANAEGRITYCSDRIQQALGYTPAEVIGHTPFDFLPKAAANGIYDAIGGAAASGRPIAGIEVWVRHKSGHLACISVSAVPVFTASHQLTGYRGVAKDVTAYTKARQREQLAFELGQQLTSMLALDDLLKTFVERLTAAFGYYHATVWRFDKAQGQLVIDAATNKPDLTRYPEEMSIRLETVPSLIARAAREQRVVVSNNVRADPDYLPSSVLLETAAEVVVPLLEGDQLLGALDVQSQEQDTFTDDEVRALQGLAAQAAIAIANARLYDRLAAQASTLEDLVAERTQEVVQERERLQAIVEHAGEGIIFTDPKGTIRYVNSAWEKITGLKAADVVGQLTRDVFRDAIFNGPDYKPHFAAAEVWAGEFHASRPDGSQYDGGMTVAPVMGPGGKVLNVVGVIHDITASKQVDQMRNKFVANVSHELRTPITNLKLYHTLIGAASEDKRSEYLATMGEQLNRLESLVEDLLDISRLDRGAIELHPEKIDLNALIEHILASYRLRAERQGLRFVIDFARDLPMLHADHHRLIQVINNLLANAINHSREGGLICVKTWAEPSQPEGRVAFSVRDSGVGIAPEDLPFIFERFFRSEATKAAGIPGTGLGLSIVHDVVELHRGTVSVESAPGQGSTFTVRLPVK